MVYSDLKDMKHILSHRWTKHVVTYIRKPPLTTVILCGIVFMAIFFRFYNTPLRYTIGYDSSRDAFVALEGARQLQLPLTGPFSSLGPFTFGPWYYIQLILFTALTHIPYAPWVYMGVSSILSVLVMYGVGTLIQDTRFGLIVAFFTAIFPIHIITGTSLSNAWNVSLFASIAMFAYLKLVQTKSSYWWGLVLGLSVGFASNAHYSSLALLVLPVLSFLHKPRRYKHGIAMALGLLITFFPLIIFDLNNHWFTLRNVLFTVIHMKERIYVANSWTIYLRDFWPSYLTNTTGLTTPIVLGMVFLSFGSILWSFVRHKVSVTMFLLLCALLVDFVQLRYYGGERSVSYLQYLQPFVLVLFTYPISMLLTLRNGVFLVVTSIVLLTLFILPRNVSELGSPVFETEIHGYVNKLVKLYPYQKFSVYGCQESDGGKAQALVLLLNIKGKIESSGFKVGFAGTNCNIPLTQKSHPKLLETPMVDLRGHSNKELTNAGWVNITPKGVYENAVRWWIENPLD